VEGFGTVLGDGTHGCRMGLVRHGQWPPGGKTTFTLKPLTALPAGQTRTVTVVASLVHDLSGTVMTTKLVFCFKVV
jgi:hypothetical protein